MSSNEDDDETMNQNNNNIIKRLNDSLGETIGKLKSFEDQIKSIKKQKIYISIILSMIMAIKSQNLKSLN